MGTCIRFTVSNTVNECTIRYPNPNKQLGRSVNNRITLEDFEVERLIFEARFPNAYQLWDKAGELSDEFGKLWSPLVLTTAQPGNVSFKLGRTLSMSVELNRASISLFYPGSKPEVKQLVAFFDLVRDYLRITVLQRLGLRILLFRTFDDQASSASALLDLGIISLPAEKVFGTDELPKSAEIMINLEGKGLSTTLRMGTQTRKVNIELPPEVPARIQDAHETLHGISVDVDFFTPMEVQVGQLGLSDWIEQVMHVFKRDLPKFF